MASWHGRHLVVDVYLGEKPPLGEYAHRTPADAPHSYAKLSIPCLCMLPTADVTFTAVRWDIGTRLDDGCRRDDQYRDDIRRKPQTSQTFVSHSTRPSNIHCDFMCALGQRRHWTPFIRATPVIGWHLMNLFTESRTPLKRGHFDPAEPEQRSAKLGVSFISTSRSPAIKPNGSCGTCSTRTGKISPPNRGVPERTTRQAQKTCFYAVNGRVGEIRATRTARRNARCGWQITEEKDREPFQEIESPSLSNMPI
jgi:hypothetical protein